MLLIKVNRPSGPRLLMGLEGRFGVQNKLKMALHNQVYFALTDLISSDYKAK